MNILDVKGVCTLIAIVQANGLTFKAEGGINGSSVFECGSKASFFCITTDNPFEVTLRVNDSDAYMCYITCYPGANSPAKYAYNFNSTAGLVEAHISSTDAADANTTFTCQKGSTSLPWKPIIKVFPKNDTSKMDIVGKDIKVTTGCTRLDKTLSFNWYKTKNQNGGYSEFLNTTQPTEDNSFCTPSDHCEGHGISSTYSVEEDVSGSLFFIKCVVVVTEDGQQNVILVSNQTFRFKDRDECISNPCNNAGTCIDQENGYNCSCQSGYDGPNCDIDISKKKTDAVKDDDLSTGAKVGIAFGCVGGVGISAAAGVYIWNWKKGKTEKTTESKG